MTKARERILDATFDGLCERGYGGLNTRDIAARAKVSKRELYAEFGNKQGILEALIAARAARMRQPLDTASVATARAFTDTLHRLAAAWMTELTDPPVVAMFRLAIAGAEDSPVVARTLENLARGPSRKGLRELMQSARTARHVRGDASELASRFYALVMGDLHVPILLGLVARPTPREIQQHAKVAVDAFLRLYRQRDRSSQ
jgi:AcrR family transcriptional regulator